MTAIAFLLASVALYCWYCVTLFDDHSILCLSDIAWAAKLLALFMVVILLVVLISIMVISCLRRIDRKPRRAISMCIFMVLFDLLIVGAFINVNGSNMGILGPNGTVYRCEFLDEGVSSYEVLFLSDANPPHQVPNEGCWFSRMISLCEGNSWFSNSSYLFDLNGTNEAYICPSSKPEVHDLCLEHLNAFAVNARRGLISSAISAFIFGIVYLWARQRNRSEESSQCLTPCGHQESGLPLIPRASHSNSADTFFPL